MNRCSLIIATLSVLTCLVYGQLPEKWNNDGYRPYFVLSPSAKNDSVESRTAAQKTKGKQFPIRNVFNRGIVPRLEYLEGAVANINKEFKTQTTKDLSEANSKITDLTQKLESATQTLEQTANELVETKSTLEMVKADLESTRNDLIDVKQSFAQMRTDLMKQIEGNREMLEVTTHDLGNTKTKVDGLSAKLDGTSKGLAATEKDLNDTKNEFQGMNRNLQATTMAEVKANVGDLTKKLSETARNVTVTNALIGDLSSLVLGVTRNLEATAKDLNGTKDTINTMSVTLTNATRTLEETQMDLKDTKTRIGNLTSKLDDATKILVTTASDLTNTKMKLHDTSVELKGTINALSGTAKELEDTKLKIGNLTMKVDGTAYLFAAHTKGLADAKTQIQAIKTDLQVTSKRSSETAIEIRELLRQMSETARNLTNTNMKVDNIGLIIFGTTQTLAKTNKDLTETKTKVDAIDMDLKNATQGFERTRNNGKNFEAEALENIKQKLEVVKRERETKSKLEGLRTHLNATMKDLTDIKTEVQAIKTDLRVASQSSTEADMKIGSLVSKLDAETMDISIDRIPTSCKDLHQIGHRKSGLYSVMGTNQVETVYCNFAKDPEGAEFQKWIGYEDVQSVPTYFYVKKDTDFSAMDIPIPYEIEVVNTGNAMHKSTGIFTAPRNGTYFFSFNGLAIFPPLASKLGASLYFNGTPIGMSFTRDASPSEDQIIPVTLQSTLKLKAGDKIWVQITYLSKGVALFDDSDNQTHFTGFLLQEDISSL